MTGGLDDTAAALAAVAGGGPGEDGVVAAIGLGLDAGGEGT